MLMVPLIQAHAGFRVGHLEVHVVRVEPERALEVVQRLHRLVELLVDLADAVEALGVGGAARHLLVQGFQLTLPLGVADLAQRQVTTLLGVDEARHVLVGVAVDQDASRRGQLLQTRGQVHHVADRGVGLPLGADEAGDGQARGDADPHGPRVVAGGHALLQLDGGQHRLDPIGLAVERRAELAHGSVAHVLIDMAAVGHDDRLDVGQVAVEIANDELGRPLLGVVGEAAQVREHHRDVALFGAQAALDDEVGHR